MKLGLQLNSFDWSGGPERFGRNLADIGRAAEEAGFDRIGVADHLWQHPIMGGPEANEPECYTTLAFLAANTERIGLTAMVSGVHFRHPAVLVKSVTTLDVLSGGRACFGVGSGHYEEETAWARHPFPPQKERFEMLEETRPDSPADVERRAGRRASLRGESLQARASLEPAAEHEQAPPADHDRRRRREEDPAPGRPLRRRLQPASRAPRCPKSSTCCAGTARKRAGTTTR